MEAVTEQLMMDFTSWKRDRNATNIYWQKDKSLLEEFMRLKFDISDISATNIFDLLKAFHSPEPKETSQGFSLIQKVIACTDQRQKASRQESGENYLFH